MPERSPSPPRTRRAIIDLLKGQGPLTASQIADHLDVTPMAIRQHLQSLQTQRLVSTVAQSRGAGRPSNLWDVTEDADMFFPDGHDRLATELLQVLEEKGGVEEVLAARAKLQIEHYQNRLPRTGSVQARLAALAKARSDEGYMAEVRRLGPKTFELVENHCPVCAAARACPKMCSSELDVFYALLGDDVAIVRTEHILDGFRRCVYRVSVE